MAKTKTVEFSIQDLWPIALVLIVVSVGIAFGFDILDDVYTSVDSTDGKTAINDSKEAMGNLTSKLPIIAVVVVAAILIGILVRYLGGMGQGKA